MMKSINREQYDVLTGLAYWRAEMIEARNTEGAEDDARRAEETFFDLYADALQLKTPLDVIRAVYTWASDRRRFLTEYTWQAIERAGYRIIAG